MACCGNSGTKKLRTQTVRPQVEKAKKVIQQRVRHNPKALPKQSAPKKRNPSVARQALVRDARCPKCGSPIMLVNIAKRERKQCTSGNCKFILPK